MIFQSKEISIQSSFITLIQFETINTNFYTVTLSFACAPLNRKYLWLLLRCTVSVSIMNCHKVKMPLKYTSALGVFLAAQLH